MLNLKRLARQAGEAIRNATAARHFTDRDLNLALDEAFSSDLVEVVELADESVTAEHEEAVDAHADNVRALRGAQADAARSGAKVEKTALKKQRIERLKKAVNKD